MKMTPIAPILLSMLICGFAGVTEAKVLFLGEKEGREIWSLAFHARVGPHFLKVFLADCA